jgi:hypothetical protein
LGQAGGLLRTESGIQATSPPAPSPSHHLRRHRPHNPGRARPQHHKCRTPAGASDPLIVTPGDDLGVGRCWGRSQLGLLSASSSLRCWEAPLGVHLVRPAIEQPEAIQVTCRPRLPVRQPPLHLAKRSPLRPVGRSPLRPVGRSPLRPVGRSPLDRGLVPSQRLRQHRLSRHRPSRPRTSVG